MCEHKITISHILFSGLSVSFIQCGEVRVNCSNESRLRSRSGESAVCEKRDVRILSPSWNFPAWKDSLAPCLSTPLGMGSCNWSVFWPSTNALRTSLFSQQVGIFDTLIRKARTYGILAKSPWNPIKTSGRIMSNPAFRGKGHGGAEIGDEAPLGPKLRSKMILRKKCHPRTCACVIGMIVIYCDMSVTWYSHEYDLTCKYRTSETQTPIILLSHFCHIITS